MMYEREQWGAGKKDCRDFDMTGALHPERVKVSQNSRGSRVSIYSVP